MEPSTYPPATYRSDGPDTVLRNEAQTSGVSWPAVFGGAAVTAALSLILLALGAGFGLEAVSPWYRVGASAPTIGMAAVIWVFLMQVISASMGGYLAGRLRTKWVGVHTDEVYFRDTAHGFLSWSVALLLTAAFLTAAATQMAGAASAAAAVNSLSDQNAPNSYFVDALFRPDGTRPDMSTASNGMRAEAGRILLESLQHGAISVADKTYLVVIVSGSAGISRADADARIDDVFARAQKAADTARTLTAHGLLWGFLAMLTGAFSASLAATFGGRQRDHIRT